MLGRVYRTDNKVATAAFCVPLPPHPNPTHPLCCPCAAPMQPLGASTLKDGDAFKWLTPLTAICMLQAHHTHAPNAQYSRMGVPSSDWVGIVHRRSNALLSTILKIFCTLMDSAAEQKMRGAFMARANLRACPAHDPVSPAHTQARGH
jgi:hypothetical protein